VIDDGASVPAGVRRGDYLPGNDRAVPVREIDEISLQYCRMRHALTGADNN
jgi:hypothetical protein